jgi:cell division protein FtsZ
MSDEVRVTVIATGFDHGRGTRAAVTRAPAPTPSPRRGANRDVTMDDRQRSSLEIRDDEIDIPSFLKDR